MNFALDHSGVAELKDLVPYVDDSTAMLFSDSDAFELSGILARRSRQLRLRLGRLLRLILKLKRGLLS